MASRRTGRTRLAFGVLIVLAGFGAWAAMRDTASRVKPEPKASPAGYVTGSVSSDAAPSPLPEIGADLTQQPIPGDTGVASVVSTGSGARSTSGSAPGTSKKGTGKSSGRVSGDEAGSFSSNQTTGTPGDSAGGSPGGGGSSGGRSGGGSRGGSGGGGSMCLPAFDC